MSTLKVGTIQDHANSNNAIVIDSGGRVQNSQNLLAQYRLNASVTLANSDNYVGTSANSGTWALGSGDSSANALLLQRGGSMTYNTANGHFTFPHNGHFRVFSSLNFIDDNNTDNNIQNEIQWSTNSGASFTTIGSQSRASAIRASAAFTVSNEVFLNVTSFANTRVRINAGSANGATITGGDDIYTKLIFQQI